MISGMASRTRTLHLSGDPEADALLTKDPLALLIGMVLDQQVPLERAFAAPAELAKRLGGPYDARQLARMDPAELAAVFSMRPALHRFPGSMAARVQALCVAIVDQYHGDAAKVWRGVTDADELLDRIRALPGFGEQKARIFVALLGKQLGIRPKGWEVASAPFGEPGSFRSVADIVDGQSLATVRAFKQQMKAAHKAAAATEDGPTPAVPAPRRGRSGAGKSTATTVATSAVARSGRKAGSSPNEASAKSIRKPKAAGTKVAPSPA
jgi:uncharacterized HhH-GPD family protein